jgi:hypothetical protein
MLKATRLNESIHCPLFDLIDKCLNESDRITYGGEHYTIAGMDADGSRGIYGQGKVLVGKLKPDKTVEIWGKPGIEKPREIHPPPISGWEVSWEQPGTRGALRQTQFFKFTKDTPECVACGGSGKSTELDIVTNKFKKCKICYGAGREAERVTDFVKTLAKRSLEPKVSVKRLSKAEKQEWPYKK